MYDGVNESKNVFIGFENEEIKYVNTQKPPNEANGELMIEGNDIVVTPAFIDSHSHIGLQRSAEYTGQYEENEQMDPFNPLANALHSIYIDDPMFQESIEHGVLYSGAFPGSGNIIGGKVVLIENFAKDIEDAFVSEIGIKSALGYHPRSTTAWRGKRPSTRMGLVSLLRESLIKAKKTQNLLNEGLKKRDEIDPETEVLKDILNQKYKVMMHLH